MNNKATYQNQNTVATSTAISLKKFYPRRSKDKLGIVIAATTKKSQKCEYQIYEALCMHLFFVVKIPGIYI